MANYKMMSVNDAMEMYRDEMSWKAEVEKTAEAPATPDMDPLWDCWYYMAPAYEPECIKDATPVVEIQQDLPDAVDDMFDFDPLYVPNAKDKCRIRVSKRRKNAAKHKNKVRRNVAIIWANYAEREYEDMMNWSFKKLKNGERIIAPKSQGIKADQILKRALKTDAVPMELRDEIVKLMEGIHNSVNVIAENKAYYDRLNRSMDLMSKMELEKKAA